MFSSVVVGVKELEAGRDALCLARALTSAKGNLTLPRLDAEVVCSEVRDVRGDLRDIGRTREADLLVIGESREDGIAHMMPTIIFDEFISIDVSFRNGDRYDFRRRSAA